MIVCFGEVLVDCLPNEEVIGGAPFNVAIHLKRLGNEVDFVSSIGADEKGMRIQGLLDNEGLSDFVTLSKEHPTGYVSVWFEGNEPKYTIHEPCSWQYLSVSQHKETPEIIVFGSLGTFFADNKEAIKVYRDRYPDAKFLCDLNLRAPMYSKQHVEFCLEMTDILKVNEDEFEYLKNEVFQVSTDEEVLGVLNESYGIAQVMLTKAEKGVEVFWDEQRVKAPAPKVPASAFQDAIGAGDSFTAVFIDLLLKYPEKLESNIGQALSFASKICANKGAIPASLELYENVGY